MISEGKDAKMSFSWISRHSFEVNFLNLYAGKVLAKVLAKANNIFMIADDGVWGPRTTGEGRNKKRKRKTS